MAEVKLLQVNFAEIGFAEVGIDVGVGASPAVPNICTLLDQHEVLGVCHPVDSGSEDDAARCDREREGVDRRN